MKADRLLSLPPYLFAEIDRLKEKVKEEGRELIDFGVGDPDLPTPRIIIEKLTEAAQEPQNHRYPSYRGLLSLREEVASWYQRRFGVELDPEREIIVLIGSKEGIAHLPLALLNPGDKVLVPDPGYPVYGGGTILAGAEPVRIPLREENDFLPSLKELEEKVGGARLLFLNYPNNPTSACASLKFFSRVVELALKYGAIIAHDLAYSEIYFSQPPPSILEIEGAKECSIEFHSLSKTFNMTGWRIGFAVGNAQVINALLELKTNIDSGVFQAVQEAAIEALKKESILTPPIRETYRRRRKILLEGLKNLGWEVKEFPATFYLWIKVPSPSLDFSRRLLEECGIVVTPGVGFGEFGEGFVRMALTVGEEKIKETLERLRGI